MTTAMDDTNRLMEKVSSSEDEADKEELFQSNSNLTILLYKNKFPYRTSRELETAE
jgi:hypothetical protein